VRMLLPDRAGDLDDDAIDAAYAWPAGPWVRANMVSTVDGAARSPAGTSRGISSDPDRRVFAALRGLADVVLVGAQTVRTEGYNPARPKPAYAQRRALAAQLPAPVIAVVSRSLDLPLGSPLFADRGEGTASTLVITTVDASQSRRETIPATVDVIDCGVGDVDLVAAVAILADRGLTRVHCEGGPHLLGDLIAGGCLDELCLTISPLLVGSTPGDTVGRITASSSRPYENAELSLAHLLVDGGSLFARYLVVRTGER